MEGGTSKPPEHPLDLPLGFIKSLSVMPLDLSPLYPTNVRLYHPYFSRPKGPDKGIFKR